MSVSQLTVSMIGAAAQQAVQGNPPVSIAGVTSRGVFMRPGQRRVIFLSLESYHGPLTLNLNGDPAVLQRLSAGEPAMLTEESIVFPALDVDVVTAGALVWQAPPTPGDRPAAAQVRANLRDTVEAVAAMVDAPQDYPGVLPDLCRLAAPALVSAETPGTFLSLLKRLSRALWDGQPTAAAATLGDCLGRGAGLTPSGDDLVLGCLLALQRWGACFHLPVTVSALRDDIIQRAHHQTTTLAANLIECAADGQADERLVVALDGMATGIRDAHTCAAYLRSWGSSSGIDALAGMACVLLAARDVVAS